MCKIVGAFLLLGLGAVLSVPLKDAFVLVGGDTAVVESTVREARQAPDHIGDLLKPDKSQGEESKTLYRVSGENKGDDKHKSFLDGFDFAYFGDGGGSSKYVGGEGKSESGGGDSNNYETNESYESGGSTSYDSGDKDEKTYSSSDGKSQSLKADDDGESESYAQGEEEDEDDY